ncbi:MAG: DNA repair protein RecN [Hahellaceae bacterium]|nr:DNA repair protein RecN [Hahellaceae bacterium]MCP5168746.1 DNA repair protein RecN [Hahellaceae bacterium]
MLLQLTVNNFAIADHADLHFDKGMTVITGETGAGKSIILDALGLALGDRADAGLVRHGEERADISAIFDIQSLDAAQTWLAENDLDQAAECILRRVVTKEGRSRGYINGQPVSLAALKELGEMLINIHSQHEHQSLLKKDTHRQLLDDYAQQSTLSEAVRACYKQWFHKSTKLEQLRNHHDEQDARVQLLRYQVQELDQLGLAENEVDELESEQQSLSNAENLLATCQQANNIVSEGETTVSQLLSHVVGLLDGLPIQNKSLDEARQMLTEAQIQVEEASHNLRHFADSFEADPHRLSLVEERLGIIYQLARKHRTTPDKIASLHQQLSAELAQLEDDDHDLDKLSAECERLKSAYMEQAQRLTETRTKHAASLAQQVLEQLKALHMPSVQFIVNLSPLPTDTPQPFGMEDVEFLVSANPGQPPKPLHKVASGGELSRISLAIQVITAQTSTIPTLVFDEVDVGIGGGTAEVVGKLLRQLGHQGQVLCVTHLPQVASHGHTHLFVSKTQEGNVTKSQISQLNGQNRIEEIARMLGGLQITRQTLAHAEEMLSIPA